MLASITPLGERGRQSHWIITVTAFLLGAAGAGALLGLALGLAGSRAFGSWLSEDARFAVLAAGSLAALGLDAGPARVPGPRRQVDERWRDQWRGWVYGLGYGAQLGVGVTTIVSSAATYLALAAALLSGSPGAGALIVGVFGALRGATPLLTAGINRPDQLVALHRGLERWRRFGALGTSAVLAGIVAGAAIEALV